MIANDLKICTVKDQLGTYVIDSQEYFQSATVYTVWVIMKKKRGICAGDVLLFHKVTLAVPSAIVSLTSVFGMRTGVASLPLSPAQIPQKGIYYEVKRDYKKNNARNQTSY